MTAHPRAATPVFVPDFVNCIRRLGGSETTRAGLRRWRRSLASMAFGLLAAAVPAAAQTAGAASQIASNAGNNQTATVGTAVATAPSVIVRDALSNPVPGVSVTFAVASGGGSLTGAAQTTNASGIATVGSWILGPTAGTNNNTVTATAGQVSGLAIGVHASHDAGGYGAQNGGQVESTPAVNTQATGSTFLVGVGRKNTHIDEAPAGRLSGTSDGNTYSKIGNAEYYVGFTDYQSELFGKANGLGGSSHRWQAAIVEFDEGTLGAVEIIGGQHIQDVQSTGQVAPASVITSPDVTTTQDAILVSYWWGSGGDTSTNMQALPSAGSGWTLLESRMDMHSGNGGIQMAIAYKAVSGAGIKTGCPWEGRMGPGLTTYQGANVYTVAVQASAGLAGNPVTFTASATASVSATVPGAPGIGTATAGNGTVAVAFVTPASNGGSPITGYTATCSGTGGPFTNTGSTPSISVAVPNGTAVTCTVHATNAVGNSLESSPSNSVTPATVPSAPGIGTATAGNGTVAVAFTTPGSNGGSPITGYTATCSGTGGPFTNTGSTPSISVAVPNGTAVTCTVHATNVAGNSPESSPSSGVTPATVPSAPGIGAATAGNGTVAVAFVTPASNGGSPITGYTATCSGTGGPFTNTGSTPSISVAVPNGTAVTCTVHATNAVGNSGESSPSNSVTPATVPSAPGIGTATAGNGTVAVAFTTPGSNGGSPITGYTATCAGTGGPFTNTGSTPSISVTVPNGTAVTCTVHATNANGNSGESSPSSSVTPATVPSAPGIGTATAGNGTVSVAFTAPGSNGGSPITGYTATCTGTGGPFTNTGSTPSISVAVPNGTAVTCTVHATNANGNSGESSPSSSVTPATVPSAPGIGTATAGNGTVAVAFTTPGSNGGSPITGYTATCSGTGGPFTNTGSTPSISVTVPNGTAVTCTVHATNVAGNSPESSPSSSVTPATVPSAPGIGMATAGNGTVAVAFTTPASNGGSPITGYTATCSGTGGPYAGTGGGSPISVTVPNGTAVTCTVHATNAVGNSGESSPSSSVTPSGGSVPALTLTVTLATSVEGNSGTAALNFTVSRTVGGVPVAFTATTVQMAPGPNTATGGGVDYINLASASFTMTAAETTKTVAVSIVGEILDENNEQFQLTLVPTTPLATINGSGVSATVNGSITDDDTATISINRISFNEGVGTAVFTISQSVPSINPTSVTFTVANNTAIAPKDYTTTTLGGPVGTRTFPATPNSLVPPPPQTLVIDIVDDILDEPTENFRITLTNPTGGSVLAGAGGSVGIGTILDTPDPQPVISIDSISFPEGSPSGTKLVNFTVSLDKASGRPISVTATTSNGTAVQPGDYVSKTQNFSFTEGSGLTRVFQVTVKQDATPEPEETFNVTLSGVTNATVGAGGVGTIQNDDAGSQIAINAGNNQTATVGTAVATAPSVIVRDALSNPVPGVSVTFAVASGGGSLTGPTQTTNASGIATAGSWILGPTAGTNNNTVTATAGQVSGLAIGVHASHDAGGYGAQNGGQVESTPAVNTQATGSTFLVGVGRKNTHIDEAPAGRLSGTSDGNTYSKIGNAEYYVGFTDYQSELFGKANGLGGSSHRWQAAIVEFDEGTLGAVEIIGGQHIQDVQSTGQVAPASVITSPDVTTTQDAILVSYWWGSGGDTSTNMQALPSAGSGWTLLESRMDMHSGNGGIQMAIAYKAVSGAGIKTGCPWEGRMGPGLTTNQGANVYTVAVQASGGSAGLAGNQVTFTASATASVSATVPDAPGIGTATAGNGTVSVAFTAPGSNGGSPITGYTATCTGTGGPFTNTGPTPSISVTVPNGTAVTCTVHATNAVGNSGESSPSNSVTPATVPSAPGIGTATAGNGTVAVAFTTPGSNGGSPITGYTATCSGVGGPYAGTGGGSPISVTVPNGTAVTCTVHATNVAGNSLESSPSSSVTPATVPSAPGIGTAIAGNGTVSVAFTAPGSNGGSPITGYTATCTGTGGPFTNTGSTPSISVAVPNGTAVTCTVHATNAVGNSGESSPSNSVTPATVPSAPGIGTATAGNGTVAVAFTTPGSNGGSPITGYTATCSGTGGPFTNTGSTPSISVAVPNGTAVTCTVHATNVAGNSPESSPSSGVTPATVPSAPGIGTATAGNETVAVAFTTPGSNGGSPITGYTATCSGTGGPFTNTGSTPSISVAVPNGTAVTCTVRATNVAGNSLESSPSSSVTPATVPSAPGIGTATAGNGTVSVAFTAPGSNGGSPITGHTATCSGVGGPYAGTGGGTPISVTVPNGTAVTCTVHATNVAGNSLESSPSSSVTPATVPSAPGIGTANAGNGTVSVAFTAPGSNGGSTITGYTAICSGTGGPFTNTGSTPSISVTVPNGTAVTCTVHATNVAGNSLESSPSGSVTPSNAGAPTVTATVPAGSGAWSVAVNPVTNKIYVANSSSDNVTVIDGATNATTSVSTGMIPSGVSANPVTNKIYVANVNSNNVTVIDGATNATTTVSAGTLPFSLAVNPVTNRIYVANYGSNNVTVIDGATNATTTVSAGLGPRGVSVNPVTNKIYVANYSGTNVTVIDGATNATTTVSAGSSPYSVAVNPVTNKIYVANEGSDDVTVIDGATNATTTVSAGSSPHSVAVNPVTNKIYVANRLGNNVTVIDGATNATTTVSAGTYPYSVAVNPMTDKIYVATSNSNNVTVIDGATNATTTVSAGSTPANVAVNPVTNKIYVANANSANVTVIDGATNATTTVSAGTNPFSVAVNPATNMVYVANQNSNNVTVIDGATNATTTVSAGARPISVAVNSMTNKIYVANLSSNNVTVIDGVTNATTTVSVGTTPLSVAVNPVTNKIYVANNGSNVTVIDGPTNATSTVAAGTDPYFAAVNPVTNKIYVVNYNSNNVTVIDGATNATTTVSAGVAPYSVAVNPATNKIYVANLSSNNVTVIDGATNAATTVSAGSGPRSVAVNPVTNKIYIANQGSNNVTVIDGATNATTTVSAEASPYYLAVNPVMNKVYVANIGGTNVTVIDGATNSTATVSPGTQPYLAAVPARTQPYLVAVNLVTNKIYVANSGSNNVTVLTEQEVSVIPLTTTITPLLGNVTISQTPTFTLSASSTFSPTAPPVQGVFTQVDTWQGSWQAATPSGPNYTSTTSTLGLGTHILYAYAVDGQQGIGCSNGDASTCSPLVGSIAAYVFTVVPPVAPGAPTIGTATAGNGTVSVAFTAPGSNGGSTITGYTAICSGTGGPFTNTGSTPSISVTVPNGTAVTCTVHATNVAGNSLESSPSGSVTAATVPSAPGIGTATAGNGTVAVAFTTPASNGGSPITGYTATCSGVGGPYAGTGGGSPISVTVPNGTAVTCTVHATNAVGNSGESSPSSSVTPSGGSVPALTLTVTPATSVEGNSGTAALNFTVSRTVGGVPVAFTATTVQMAPGPNTATGGGVDYINLASASFTMTAAETTKTVAVSIVGEILDENNEQFQLTLVPTTPLATINGSAVSAAVLGSITDDDTATISINRISFNEGVGTAVFTISQSVPSINPTSVTFTVANNTAIAPKDYTTTTLGGPVGTRTFPATPNSLVPPPPQTLVIDIVDDLLDEPTENFRITLTNPTGGAVLAGAGGSVGIGTILDTPDPQPVISIDSISFPEGSPSGTKLVNFTVSLDKASGRPISVTATTSNGTAVQPGDYVSKTQNFSFAEGSGLTRVFQVTVKQDAIPEPDETFNVTLSGVTNATVGGGGFGVGTIQNDDAGIQTNDVATSESGGSLVFTVTRTATAAGNVTFNYATSGGTAIGGASCAVGTDYLTTSGSGSIAASVGVATTTITVPVCDDGVSEGHDTFNVTLSSVVGAPVVNGTGAGTINNDDAIPSGALKISEFRYNGPNGALDQFVEIANTTTGQLTIGATDLSAGLAVASAGATLFVIPNGTTIPAGGHFLGTHTGYSLANYGGVAAANGNAAFQTTLGVEQGIALFDTAAYDGLTTPLDAVGFAGNGSQYLEGAGIPLAAIPIPPGVAADHSFVRKYADGAGSGVQDLNDSLTDWALVATDPGADPSLTAALLGGPSPENLAAENDRLNGQVTVSGSGSVFTGVPGPGPVPVPAVKALEFRRTFTNNTGGSLLALRFKVSALTGVNNPVPGQADLRPTDSATVATFQGLTLEALPGGNYIQTTPATGSFPAGVNLNGGLNSTLRLSSGLPLANLGTVDVNFRVEYTATGAPFYFWVVPAGK